MDTKERLRTAVHETLHALTGMRCGRIHKVTLWPAGETQISFCLLPFMLARNYARWPDKSHRDMVAILASHIAPHVIMKCPLQGADAELVEEWRVAYDGVKGALHWKTVLSEARMAVREWYATPGREELVTRVATALEKRTCVHGDKQWRAFVASCLPSRQTPRSVGSLDLNRLVENIICLQGLYGSQPVGHGSGLVQS